MDSNSCYIINHTKYYLKLQNKKLLCELKKTKKDLNKYKLKDSIPRLLFFVSGLNGQVINTSSTTFNIVLPIAGSFSKTFTDIPYHYSANMGTAENFINFANAKSSNQLTANVSGGLFSNLANILKTEINKSSISFIDQLPNCTLTVVNGTLDPATGNVYTVYNTIASMTTAVINETNAVFSFELLPGNDLIPDSLNDSVSITIDDFWDILSAVVSGFGSVACWVGLEVVTVGIATGVCVATTVGAVAAIGKAT